MRAKEIMAEQFAKAKMPCKDTVDPLKAGSAEREVKKLATCFIATPEVIRAAADWGADLLITHEPTYYDHRDYDGNIPNNPVMQAKKALLDGTGIPVYRLHDHMHAGRPDGIIAGELKKLQWDCDYDNEFAVHLHQKKTAREIAAELEKKWGLARVRMAGDLDTPMDGVYLMIGAFGEENHMKQLQKDDCQVLVVGETSEWRIGEYIRDAHQLGFHKALLVCGHVGSERGGMEVLAEEIAQQHPDIECRYFEVGEVYSYLN